MKSKTLEKIRKDIFFDLFKENKIANKGEMTLNHISQPRAEGWLIFGKDEEYTTCFPIGKMPNKFQRFMLRIIFGIYIKENGETKHELL